MSYARASQFDTKEFKMLCDFVDDCIYEITPCADLFTATSITIKGNSGTHVSFNSIINLLMVKSGKVGVIDGPDYIELFAGNICLIEEQDEFLIKNADPLFDAEVISVEMNLSMVARFKNRYDEILLKRQEQTDSVEVFACTKSNRIVFESCNFSIMALEAFSVFVREEDKGLCILKMEELMLLKLKSTNGSHLAFHILNRCDPAKEKYRNFVEYNVLNDWSLATYAKNLGMSLTSFKVMFKQVFTESSPKAWINERRLAHADKLLRATRMRLIDIAMESGFSSQSYFTQSYKARFGYCPSNIRSKKIPLKRM